jgi:hypothetical protein
MKPLALRAAALAVAILSISYLGCSGGGEGAKVTGMVTMDGQPLSDAEVVFEPIDPNKKGQGGDITRTDAQGKFTFTSDRKKFGLRPGKYKVYVSKWVDKKTGEVPSPEDYEMKKMGKMLTNKVDEKYSNHEIDPALTAEVKGSGDDFKFEVTADKTAAPAPKKK